jgi:1,4-dihydroxy-2-naphthoate octaprenyltransferase
MENVKQNSLKAWMLAARPKTLSGAAIPVLIGTAFAYADGGFKAIPALVCLLFAMLMQVAANFINDLYDFKKGTDRSDRLGPERACAQGWISPEAMTKGIATVISVACLAGLTLLAYAGPWLMIVGALCVVFAFFYTTGPYPLSYNGWGDLLVLIFFGFVPVGGTYYVQTLNYTADIAWASLACGLVIDTLLVVNNYRDRDADRLSGKRTVVVRFGERFGRRLYYVLGIIANMITFFAFAIHREPMVIVAIIAFAWLHKKTYRRMVEIGSGRELNVILGETSRNMLVYGVLLSAAIAFGQYL